MQNMYHKSLSKNWSRHRPIRTPHTYTVKNQTTELEEKKKTVKKVCVEKAIENEWRQPFHEIVTLVIIFLVFFSSCRSCTRITLHTQSVCVCAIQGHITLGAKAGFAKIMKIQFLYFWILFLLPLFPIQHFSFSFF